MITWEIDFNILGRSLGRLISISRRNITSEKCYLLGISFGRSIFISHWDWLKDQLGYGSLKNTVSLPKFWQSKTISCITWYTHEFALVCIVLPMVVRYTIILKAFINICHTSSRTGEILNSCSNFEIFSTFVWPEWSLCRGQLAVPGQKCWRQSKHFVHISCPHLDDQVEAFQVVVLPEILNFEVTLRLIHTYSTLVTLFF